MKGIILAGGFGTRLYPTTKGISKQLLPIFDKPLIYYSLCTLMEANIKDIICITTPEYKQNFVNLLGDGSSFGIKLTFLTQEKPTGIAQAFILSEKYIKDENVCLILGDNIFYGYDFKKLNLKKIDGAYIFTYEVPDPQRYGVLEVKNNKIFSIREKPKKPKSFKAITGIYFFDKSVVNITKKLKPSKRNELEITDVIKTYLKQKKLKYYQLGNGSVWLDAGTSTSLLQASQFVQTIQERQNIQIGSPEQISLINKWITKTEFKKTVKLLPKNSYSSFLKKLM
jgi:glucose-1-phosphate thymidylyltransferase